MNKLDKLNKVKSFICFPLPSLKLQFLGAFSDSQSIEQGTTPFTGRHSAKNYRTGNPIKFDYELWVLDSSRGYPFQLQVYLGKEKKRRSCVNERPLKTRVIPDFTECIEISGKYKVDVDNFLSSLQLLEEM